MGGFSIAPTSDTTPTGCGYVDCCSGINYIGACCRENGTCEDATESLVDLVESKLIENIKENDNTSIIFFLKTKGKKRGYIEKQEIEHIRPISEIEFDEGF